jgi:protein ATS1
MMLYAFGSNGSGQLGLPHKQDSSTPQSAEIQNGKDIKQIVAGGNHTLILYGDGEVYAYGPNDHIACVHGAAKPKVPYGTRYRRFSLLASQVSATWEASFFVSACGKTVHAHGQGLSGELGLGHGVTQALEPTPLPGFPPAGTNVVQVSSCVAHTVVILDNGEVWGWGKGRKGQLGEPSKDIWSPRKIEGIRSIVLKAVCGKDFTCLVSSQDGQTQILGLGKNDRFGLRSSLPASVRSWTDMVASWGSVFILKQDHELLGFGRDDHGQLPPPGLPPISAIAAGSEHCVALTTAGKVLAWGWGEHGNCGTPTDENGDVKGTWNEIVIAGDAKAVFAGCATGFVVTASPGEPG